MNIFLSKLPGVEIKEFNEVEKLAGQNNFWESKKLDINTALDMGLMMKAKHIITGDYKVNKEKDTILINVYVYDVTTGDLILKRQYEDRAGADIFDTIDKIIKNISSLIIGRTITEGKLKVDVEAENKVYKLFINGNYQKDINKGEGYMENIVAEVPNEISLRIPGQGIEKEVYRNFITVKEGEVYSLDYFPSGSVTIKTKPFSEIFINNVSFGKAGTNGELNL